MTTTQMTVRLPDDLAAFVDDQVGAGVSASRAAVIATALRHERRRLAAERDAEIYATTAPDADLDAFAAYASAHPVAID